MIRLELKREPYWLDLAPGVRIRVRPCTTALVMAARASIPVEGDDDNARGVGMLRALAQAAIIDWEGISDEAGDAVAPTAERIDALLDLYPVFRTFETTYFLPALVLDEEKNVSAPAPHGTCMGLFVSTPILFHLYLLVRSASNPLLVPTRSLIGRCAQRRSRLAAGHREATCP